MSLKGARELLDNARTHEIWLARSILIEIADEVLRSVEPAGAVKRYVKLARDKLEIGSYRFDLKEIGKIVVVGCGKASGTMAAALEELLGDKIAKGVVAVPKGIASRHSLARIELVEADHPLPSKDSITVAEEVLSAVRGLGSSDLVICLLSGGGSALLTLPAEGLTLDDIREVTDALLKSGADIRQINAVRKHLSRIKGGWLAKAAYPARLVNLVMSDVVGDVLDTIASGPTVPDATSYADALEVLKKYGLADKASRRVLEHLEKGIRGEIPETPKAGDPCFRNVSTIIVANNASALQAAVEVGSRHGLESEILTTAMQGEAREVGQQLAKKARELVEQGVKNRLLLMGGETAVTVRGSGVGGRNQELALSLAIGIAGLGNIAAMSLATDGIDGPTDAAGAICDSHTVERARELGLDPNDYLARNDSYTFFRRLDDLLITGSTGTNVMDVVALIIL